MRFRLWVNVFFSTILTGMLFAQSFTSSPAAISNVLTLCTGSQVLFTNTSAGVSTINWTFQGGSPASSNITGPHIHYATLHGVSSITNTEIPNLRALVNPFFDEIYLNRNVQNFFVDDFDNYKKIISRMYLSEIIAANNIHSPFLINVRYERLELLKNPIACRVIPNNVNQWKTNVNY